MSDKDAERDSIAPPSTPNLGDADFRRLSRFIEEELGIRMPDTKRIMLESRLQKRLRQFGMKSFTEYLDYVFSAEGKDGELINMIDAVTTNKTDFFREADHFDYLFQVLLPRLSADCRGRTARFWSAGCSTGEEPYTLAMVLEEYRERNPQFSYRILASDISTHVLSKAAAGIYEAEKVEPVPASFKKKYMLRSKDSKAALVRMKPELRARVEFTRINLMEDRYPLDGDFDLVFCRNVIIYFERRIQALILGKICSHIRKGGWLLLGHSETLTGMDLPLRSLAPTIYERL